MGVWEHCMWVHMLAEPAQGPQLPTSVVPTATYGELHPWSSRVPICLRNLSAHPIEVLTKATVGQATPANQVPPVVLPMEASGGSGHDSQQGWIQEALSLQGLGEWPEAKQEQARELLLIWEHLFANSDLDLGKTSWSSTRSCWQIWCPSRSVTDIYPHICMMTWRPISKRCWILVPSGSHTVHGLVQ